MKRTATICLVLLLGCLNGTAGAEELQWRPVQASPAGPPTVRLAGPVPLSPGGVVNGNPTPTPTPREERQEESSIIQTSMIIRAQAPGVPPVPPPAFPGTMQPFGEENYNCGNVLTPGPGQPIGGYWDNLIAGITTPTGGRGFLQSDHCFDGFISPVTNPFYFEDPRALTELRPIYMYQRIPSGNPAFGGGNAQHFSLQGRLAFTEWLSLTIHKLGWTWINPNDPAPGYEGGSGFSELHMGPKFTFLRNEQAGVWFGQSVMAAGLVFEMPVGSSDVFQDTGTLSLRPYLSYAQQLLDTPYGRFNFLSTVGYSFGVDSRRTDLFFFSAHLDFDWGKYQRFYPFIELNYFNYPSSGNARDLDFEGRDLVNFGARHVSGNNNLSLAVGARYLFSQHIQFGAAFEQNVTGRRDMMDFRLTFDMIFRY